jgi:acyl-ACP thioesterase
MEGRIRYSECGKNNKATIATLINYFQDCTSENSERSGVGVEYLKNKKRAWILNSWQVFVKRMPVMSEEIVVSTWATGFQGVFGPRDFAMETKDGEQLACAHTLWVYVDTETGRPTKPDEEEMQAYYVGEPLPIETLSRKIKFPEGAVTVDTFSVHQYHIDTNKHVNNSQYIQFAEEILPEDFRVTGMRVEYKKAAVYGETITLKCASCGNQFTVVLCDAEDAPYAIVEFTGEK